MIKSITKVGNGHALLIDKPILEMLGLGEGSKVRLTISGGSLIVMPLDRQADDDHVQAAAARAHEKYGDLFKRLA